MSIISRLFSKPRVVLTGEFGGATLLEITDTQVPEEARRSLRLADGPTVLELRDSVGTAYRYDLASARGDGAAFAHCSIRVDRMLVVWADCLLSETADVPREAFSRNEASGIRLQPFFLPGSTASSEALVGRGLFFRGLHFSGAITPGNVSLLCICDSCRESFRLQSFHAGFSNLVYFYCESGTHTLVASSYLDGAPPLLAEGPRADIEAFERRLPPCDRCGTRFRYYNPFRCPACRAPYIDFGRHPSERQAEYYGNVLYGEATQQYDPDAGAGKA